MDVESEFVLGVDLDGVVADFARGLKCVAAEWLEVHEAELTDEITYGFPEWNLDRCGGYEALHRFAVKERSLFERLPPLPGAASTLRELSTAGVRIRIITHRLYIPWFHREAIRQTTDWLERFGIPYWDLCFMRDKAAVGAHLYVEDSPENILALRRAGHETIVFRNSTNRPLAPPAAESWQEVKTLVLARFEEWSRGANS